MRDFKGASAQKNKNRRSLIIERTLAAGVAATGVLVPAAVWAQAVIDQIPKPSGTLTPSPNVIWFGLFNLALMATAFVAMFYMAWRTKSVVPLFFLLGGAIGGLVEPVFDGNIHVVFATQDQPPNWYFYNVGYPWFVIPGNAMMGAPIYFLYRQFQKGFSRKGLWIAFFGFWMFNNCWEVPGTTLGSYEYFGPHPFKFNGYPLWIGMMAGLGLPFAAFVSYGIANVMEGPARWLTTAALIPVAIYGSEVITWPMWLSLNGGGTVEISRWMAALSLVFVLIAYNTMVEVYLKGRQAKEVPASA